MHLKPMQIELVRPSLTFKTSFLEALRDFLEEKLPWMMDLDPELIETHFEAFVDTELHKRTLWTQDTPVDESVFWAIENNVVVGLISIRHALNEDLKVMDGHIGYDTAPAHRRRGVASEMLKKALPVARSLGIERAHLTCNDSNSASIRVIEKNGGVLSEAKPQFEGGPLKRYYWIDLR
jgi:predicted acetyltransferase